MGTRSKVAIALKKNVVEALSKELRNFLFTDPDFDRWVPNDKDGSYLIMFNDIHWPIPSDVAKGNDSGDVVEKLIGFLKTQRESDYLVVEAGYNYLKSTEGDMGKWNNNPWKICRVVTTDILIDSTSL